METAGAYGARKAGSVPFDPVAFFTHPRTILRLLSWWVTGTWCPSPAVHGQEAGHNPDRSPVHRRATHKHSFIHLRAI
ncbi:hypothetical protein ILYODFUR_029558 [Ilyodon furcidens]|uniref:Uncharacterized protein n=1 Tax=Ilyodon furcidens TaxID=33524 RepID=A0ABV0U9J3_9TELE